MIDVMPTDSNAMAIPCADSPCSNCRYINVDDVSVFGGRNIRDATSSLIDIQNMSIHPDMMPGRSSGNVIDLNSVQPLLPDIEAASNKF